MSGARDRLVESIELKEGSKSPGQPRERCIIACEPRDAEKGTCLG